MTQGSTFYVYDPWGRRIWKQWTGQNGANECEAYFYGATGKKLESYSCEYAPGTTLLSTTLQGINTYFGGKMLSEKGVFVATDQLGSVRATSNGESLSYFPWGEERGTGTADGRTKFAGYYRDQPGQDYANARYYSATTGSFWSPDPGGMKTTNASSPGTWNRYVYVAGDPINFKDPSGTVLCSPSACPEEWEDPPSPCDEDPTIIGCGGSSEGAPPMPGSAPSDPGGAVGGTSAIAIPTKAPPCAQSQTLAAQALNNIVTSVGQVLSASGLFSQTTISEITNDLTANESAQGDVGFVGGHFNLILTGADITNLDSTAATALNGLFISGNDGSASGVLGLFANGPRHDQSGGTSLHSQSDGNGGIDFHLDIGNPYNDIVGIVSHLGHDILPPRIGRKPCLDAPFASSGKN